MTSVEPQRFQIHDAVLHQTYGPCNVLKARWSPTLGCYMYAQFADATLGAGRSTKYALSSQLLTQFHICQKTGVLEA